MEPISNATELQWGHDVTVAEILEDGDGAEGVGTLQWGHDVTVAEMNAIKSA